MNPTRKNIIVVGSDSLNMERLKRVDRLEKDFVYRFHPLFDYEEIKPDHQIPIRDILKEADSRLSSYGFEPDGFVGFWDFPVSSLVRILEKRFGMATMSLKSEFLCEHKYLSRCVQKEVVPECVPDFELVDPYEDDPKEHLRLDYPFWLKPVKASSSQLGFHISNDREFDTAIHTIRQDLERFARPFNELLNFCDDSDFNNGVDAYHCIAEKIISGRQCTVSGYVFESDVHVYGIVDSINYPNKKSFFRYQYPSKLPRRVKERLIAISKNAVSHIGLNNTAFNIEHYCSEPMDKIWLLEINPRISQSHGSVYDRVDGAPNHKIMVELSIGKKPQFSSREGDSALAAKIFYRIFEKCVVKRVPDKKDIEAVKNRYPGTIVEVLVDEGCKVEDLVFEDSYSYKIAIIHMGAHNQQELLENYREAIDMLNFQFEPVCWN